ncbi:MAG: hypothetical protein ACK4GO_06145 [Gemmobacter sp.]
MALAKTEIEWIEATAGLTLVEDVAKAESRNAQKDKYLSSLIGEELGKVRGQIDEAVDFEIDVPDGKGGTKKMKWRARNEDTNTGILQKMGVTGSYELRADVEVDTRADIHGDGGEIPPDRIEKVTEALDRIAAIEKNMRLQFDENGEPLFSDDEIRKELWTPLVRSGLIPDNMVPDGMSEHAVAFEGARSLYADKIEEHSAGKTKGQERFKDFMRIGKEVVKLGTAIASNSVTIANTANVKQVNDQLTEANTKLKEMSEGTGVTPEQIQDQRDVIDGLKANLQHFEKMSTYAETAGTLLMGGLELTETIVDGVTQDKDLTLRERMLNTVKKSLDILKTMTLAAIDTGMRAGTKDGGYNLDGMITCVKCATSAAMTGTGMGVTMAMVVVEKDPKKRLKLINGMISEFAGAVADSINAVGGKIATGGEQVHYDQQAHLSKIASAIKVAIVQGGKATEIYEAIQAGDTKALALLLGGSAFAIAMSASAESIYSSIRTDVSEGTSGSSDIQKGIFQEDTGPKQQMNRDTGTSGALDTIGDSTSELQSTITDGITGDISSVLGGMTAQQLEAELAGLTAKKQEELAIKSMEGALTAEAMKEVLMDADAEVELFGKTYSDAFPDPGLPEKTPEEIIQAQRAIERAMANTDKLRQRVALINGITAAGASVLAAVVPGTGAVVAAQKVAADIYALKKCVDVHNAWCESMEVAMAGQGGAAAAIQNTLHNAKIHLSQASVRLVLDTLKASAEVARVFDATGIATGVSAGISMASATVEFGFAMHKEVEIRNGWKAWKDATSPEGKGNRKAARKALRLNSTLAKCCIAYGASIMGDPAAQEAIAATGLTVAALQDDKDICVKLVNYLEHQLNEDPEVLRVEYSTKNNWQPGTPVLTLQSWVAYKAAAHKSAQPTLAKESLSTGGIDRLLAELAPLKAWNDAKKVKKVVDEANAPPQTPQQTPVGPTQERLDLIKELETAIDLLSRLETGLKGYAPLQDTTGSASHVEMKEAAAAFATMARGNLKLAQKTLERVKI